VSGANDQVAHVVLRTLPTFHAPLSVFVDAPSLILDTPDDVPTAVLGFDTIQAGTAEAGAVEVPSVPEPSAWVPAVLALLAALLAKPGNYTSGTYASNGGV
jgi:hypothetical protein